MGTINPEPQQFRSLFAHVPAGAPVVMLNLLRFRARASYPDGDRGLGGAQAYARYMEGATPHLAAAGGEVVWKGKAHQTVIGPTDERWDEVLLVRYPSVEAFAAMITQPAYQALTEHRTAALEDSRLIAMVADVA